MFHNTLVILIIIGASLLAAFALGNMHEAEHLRAQLWQ